MAKNKKDKQRSIKHTHKRADKIYVLLFIAHFHQLQPQDYTPNFTIPSNASLSPFETPKPIAHLARFAQCSAFKSWAFNFNYFALQELNISPNHFHLPDRTSWVPFLLARRRISLAPGNRTTVNVEPCIVGHPQHFGKWVRKKGEGTTSMVMAEI